jgi:hypothetical protein
VSLKPTFVCWRWTPKDGYRSTFTPATVRVLRNMLQRHYRNPADFVCVTDTPEQIDPEIQTVRLWDDYGDLTSPHGPHNPSCYRRLRMFAPDADRIFKGTRLISLDLDTVIVRDVAPLFDRTEDFVAFQETDYRSFYNGSFLMLTVGTRTQVWDTFRKHPARTIAAAKAQGRFGSDQAIISHVLGKGEATWTPDDGMYSFRVHLKDGTVTLPANARIVSFHGGTDPWNLRAQQIDWVKGNWR